MSTVFLVEPYNSGSHQAWAEGYQSHSSHDVHLLTLPAGVFIDRALGVAGQHI